jgi:tRNA A-37 threonylcarbamoyl transferase component Bud32
MPEGDLHDRLQAAVGDELDLIRLIGRGGMAEVHLARDRALDRLVVIKVLPPDSADKSARERFRREARLAAQLEHPNIVRLYSYGESDDLLYFVMEYIRGETLGQLLDRVRALPPSKARAILDDITGALVYAHGQGVIHRDVKPSNILIDDITGRAMLADFGISRSVRTTDGVTDTRLLIGTPAFMSPEQAAGDRELDGRSDLYSLGVVGYNILAGNPPFLGTTAEIIRQHIAAEAPALKEVVPNAPDDLAMILARCLAKDPADRWSDAASLRRALNLSRDAAERVLPTKARDVPEVFAISAVFAYIALLAAFANALEHGRWALFIVIAFLLCPGLPIARVIAVPAGGMRRRDLLRMALLPPRWWIFPYPARLRRSNDVWKRLPKQIRATRNQIWGLIGFTLAVLPFAILGVLHSPDPSVRRLLVMLPAIVGGLIGAFVGGVITLRRWLKQRDIEDVSAVLLLLASTSDSRFWTEGEFASLLDSESATGPVPPADVLAVTAVKS